MTAASQEEVPCQLHVFYGPSKGLGLYFRGERFASMYSKLSQTDVLWFYWGFQEFLASVEISSSWLC